MIKSKLLLFLLLVTNLAFTTTGKAQQMDTILSNYYQQYPQQKVYVHFDKNLYRAGETIWFKGYLLEAGQPASLSKNFYAELIDNNGTVVQRKVYPLIAASASGSMALPENTASNTFRFRAYTTWMLNFDSAFLFEKNIQVIGKSNSDVKSTEQKQTATLTFFPEGGDLVNGLTSVVAFMANDELGLPVSVKGKIVNEKGETVASFKDEHDGMGSFNLKPLPNEKYSAVWTNNTGKEITTVLPIAKSQGIVLHITDGNNKKDFKIERTDSVSESWKRLNIVATINQQPVAKAIVPLAGRTKNGSAIPTQGVPSGVLQVTVFSANWEPLAERVTMIKNDDFKSNVSLNVAALSFSKREKNVFELQLPDTSLTNLSISITDGLVEKIENKDNIVSRMLLTGDVKGYVHNASWYFDNNSDSVARFLDLVMLTHGWRRYNWHDMVQGIKPKIKYPFDSYVRLQAKVFGISPISPLRPDEKLTAIMQGKDSSIKVIVLDKLGKDGFTSDVMPFYDTVKVYYQFLKDRNLSQSATVRFANGLYEGPKKINNLLLTPRLLTAADSAAMQRSTFFANETIKYASIFKNGGNLLGNVTVKTRVKSRAEQLDDKYASGLFSGGDAYSFDVANDSRAAGSLNALSYIQGQVAGLQISGENTGDPSVTWRGSATSFYLDEMSVDAQTFASTPMSNIAYIKVFRPIFFGPGSGGAGGAVVAYTRKGGDEKPLPGKGLEMNTVVGYSAYKEFYSPNYSRTDESEQPDFRTTLYWNPFIFLDGTKTKARVEFYNNDASKSFKVVVEGVNELGQLIRIEKTMQ